MLEWTKDDDDDYVPDATTSMTGINGIDSPGQIKDDEDNYVTYTDPATTGSSGVD